MSIITFSDKVQSQNIETYPVPGVLPPGGQGPQTLPPETKSEMNENFHTKIGSTTAIYGVTLPHNKA